MAVTSKAELIEFCYRQLGAPLVEINMTEEQANDNIDEAIEYFRDYYFDGIERMYVKHKITQTDITNKYITLPNTIFGVNKVFPLVGASNLSTNIFDVQYQLRMNDLRDLTSTSLIYYSQVMQHIGLIDQLLNTQTQFRWNKLTEKLYLDFNWGAKAVVDDYLLIDCYAALDPETAPKMWDNRWLKKYVTAKFKQQWGSNIKKYSGVTLPGNITLDGQALYEEGKQEVADIEDSLMNSLAPLEFTMG